MQVRRHQRQIHITRDRRKGRDQIQKEKAEKAEREAREAKLAADRKAAEERAREASSQRARNREDLIRLGLLKPKQEQA